MERTIHIMLNIEIRYKPSGNRTQTSISIAFFFKTERWNGRRLLSVTETAIVEYYYCTVIVCNKILYYYNRIQQLQIKTVR